MGPGACPGRRGLAEGFRANHRQVCAMGTLERLFELVEATGVGVGLLWLAMPLPAATQATTMASLPDLPQTEIAIVELTNAFRHESRLGALKPNAALTAAARAFAEYLAKTGKFAHEADGRGPGQRAAASGYRYCQIAENLALNLDSRGFETRPLARAVVEG